MWHLVTRRSNRRIALSAPECLATYFFTNLSILRNISTTSPTSHLRHREFGAVLVATVPTLRLECANGKRSNKTDLHLRTHKGAEDDAITVGRLAGSMFLSCCTLLARFAYCCHEHNERGSYLFLSPSPKCVPFFAPILRLCTEIEGTFRVFALKMPC